MYEKAPGKLILRDYLALDRTHLANERTLLAYIRTALMSLVSAVTLIKLFADSAVAVAAGYLLLPFALGVALLGGWRFLAVRRHIGMAPDRGGPGAGDDG